MRVKHRKWQAPSVCPKCGAPRPDPPCHQRLVEFAEAAGLLRQQNV